MKAEVSELEPKHCDDYIEDYKAAPCLRLYLLINRSSASTKLACGQAGCNPKLFADYDGKRVRVVMASRMGDVGITEHLDIEWGYSMRVYVDELSNFGARP